MNLKTTLYLLIALALIGIGFLVLYPEDAIPPTTPGGASNAMFSRVEFDPAGLRTVHVNWADKREVTLERDLDGNWMQVEPVRFPLHRAKMELGVSITAATLMYTSRFKEGDAGMPTLEQTGLDKPTAWITFIGAYNELDPAKKTPVKSTPYEQKIAIGNTTVGGRAYIRVNDSEDIYVVNRDLHDVLLRDAIQEWRIKQLEAPTETQARRISMTVEGETFSLRKETGDEWVLEPPHEGRINPLVIKALVHALNKVTIARFEDENPKNLALFGLDEPRVEITVETPQLSIQKRTLRIGGPADSNNISFYATWSQEESANRVVFTILKNDRAKFMPKVSEIRDPRISLFRSQDVRSVKVQRGSGETIALDKSSTEGWSFSEKVSSPKYKPDGAAVGRILDALTKPLAYQYREKAKRDADPLAIIELNAGPGKDERLLILPTTSDVVVAGGEKVYMVFRDDETTGYLIKQEELAPLFEPIVKLRDREVLELKAKKMRRIIVKRWDGVEYTFQAVIRPDPNVKPEDATPARWVLAGYEDMEANAFGYLLGAMANLRCDAWLAKPADIGKKSVEISVNFVEGNPIKLTLDTETFQANMAGLEYGLVMPKAFASLVTSEFRYRSVLPIGTNQIETVTVKAKDAPPLTMQRDDVGRFNAIGVDGQPVPGIKLNYGVAAKLYDALSPLRVERYIEPMEVDVKDAMLTITVKTKELATHVIYIGFKENPKACKLGDRWFTIGDQTAVSLFSDSTKAEEPRER